MNFGASHLVQTSALLKKDSKRSLGSVLTLHASPKTSSDCHYAESFSSPRSELSRDLWQSFSDSFEPRSLLVEQADFHQYGAAAEIIIEQLRETMELSVEELRRHKDFKRNFERFLEAFEGTKHCARTSFVVIKEVIRRTLETLFVHGARSATPDFKDQLAAGLMRGFIALKAEEELA